MENKKTVLAAEEPVRLKKRSYWGEVWHRLKKNPVAMICLAFLAVLILGIIFVTVISPFDYTETDLTARFQTPSKVHWLGTDDYGRDLLTRLLVGGRYSLLIAILSVAIGIVCGMIVGALCGYFGKYVDSVFMRIMDVIMSIPGMMLAICISVALGSGVFNTALALAVGTIPMIARQLRSSTMLINSQEYIEAARSFGQSDFRIIMTHIIPNTLAPIIVQTSLYIGGAIMGIAGLSFLGLGVQPPTPEWGSIMANGRDYIRDFYPLVTFPGIAIMLTLFGFNMFGDGLRDALDPRLKR